MRYLFCLVCFAFLFSSCVTNRKIQYFQNGQTEMDMNPLDSVLRKYKTEAFQYLIQPQDAIFVKFESKSNQDFDFLSSGQQSAINVAQAANLISELVDDNGFINLPVLGKIHVAGLSIFEIEEKLQNLANQYLEAVHVRVRLVNFRFTILGEVNREGVSISNNNRITLPEAIGLAGGLGEFADRSNIKLIRQKGRDVEVSYVNLLDEQIISSPYYYIHQNDILVVPPLKQRPFRRYFGQNLGLFVSTISLILLTINLRN
ncbi:MAG: polysaccharide biosynthesis/export family protein [Cyclobacteriaceae bacterium]|nr:polysaccharide biosynthesis/export family protein [Cyclobacteriaceae bacterium]